MFDNVHAILWDFDGVILDSNSVRDLGFSLVLEGYPEDQVNQLLDYHKANGGLSRYVKFKYFYEEVRGEKLREEDLTDLAERFSKIMRERLARPELLIDQTLNFIRAHYNALDMYIVSGSDQNELRFLTQELHIHEYFKGIYGSPTPKTELVARILDHENVNTDSVVLIGDSKNDLEAALDHGIRFYGFNNPELQGQGQAYIHSFPSDLSE